MVPDYPPRSRSGLVDRLAPLLPWGIGRFQVTLILRHRRVQRGVVLVRPWLAIVTPRRIVRVCRLPGTKASELWDVTADEWMQ